MGDAWVAGVDASFSPLDDKGAIALAASNVKVYVGCLWTAATSPSVCESNLKMARKHGLKIAGYASINGNRPGAWHMLRAREQVADDVWNDLQRVVVDVELPGIHTADVRAAVEAVANMGKPKDIYTSRGYWNGQGNLDEPGSTGFQDCGLWDASWTGKDEFKFVPYGGWTEDQVIGQQYTGGTTISGMDLDRDIFRASAFGLEDDVNFKLYEDRDGAWWLVERDEAFPYSRREIVHQVGKDYLKQRHGEPVKVGADGEYTEGEFGTIPIIGADDGSHSHG